VFLAGFECAPGLRPAFARQSRPFFPLAPRARAPCASTPSTLLPPLSLAIVCTHQNQTLVSFLGVGYLQLHLHSYRPSFTGPILRPASHSHSHSTRTRSLRVHRDGNITPNAKTTNPRAKPWPRRHSRPQPRKHPRPRQRPRPRRPLFGAPSPRTALISAYCS
jgi:hypothetical protein